MGDTLLIDFDIIILFFYVSGPEYQKTARSDNSPYVNMTHKGWLSIIFIFPRIRLTVYISCSLRSDLVDIIDQFAPF